MKKESIVLSVGCIFSTILAICLSILILILPQTFSKIVSFLTLVIITATVLCWCSFISRKIIYTSLSILLWFPIFLFVSSGVFSVYSKALSDFMILSVSVTMLLLHIGYYNQDNINNPAITKLENIGNPTIREAKSIDNFKNKYKNNIKNHRLNEKYIYEFFIARRFSIFKGVIHIQKGVFFDGAGIFSIITNDKTIYTSPLIAQNSRPIPVMVDITGCNNIKLVFNRINGCQFEICIGDGQFLE